MKAPFIHKTPVIFISIGLIVVSTIILSFVSTTITLAVKIWQRRPLLQSNTKLASHYVELIEQKIVDNDLMLLTWLT